MTIKYTLRVHYVVNDKNDVRERSGPDRRQISDETMAWWDAMEVRYGDGFRYVSAAWYLDNV